MDYPFVWSSARTAVLAAAAWLLVPACFDDSSPVDPVAGSGSSGMPPGGVCVPGATQGCLCPGQPGGVQVCNAMGTGFDACECPGGPPTGSGSTSDADTTTGPSDTTATGTEGPVDTGPSDDTSGPETTGPGDPPYQPCPGGILDCPTGESCLSTGGASPETLCVIRDCMFASDCPPPPMGSPAVQTCVDIDGLDPAECVLACVDDGDCPPGMVCYAETAPNICLWPTP